jgi:hypothetical protein
MEKKVEKMLVAVGKICSKSNLNENLKICHSLIKKASQNGAKV